MVADADAVVLQLGIVVKVTAEPADMVGVDDAVVGLIKHGIYGSSDQCPAVDDAVVQFGTTVCARVELAALVVGLLAALVHDGMTVCVLLTFVTVTIPNVIYATLHMRVCHSMQSAPHCGTPAVSLCLYRTTPDVKKDTALLF